MRFLHPAGLWLLLGVPILIIIYLIKAHHEDRPVSSTYIWKLSERFMKKRLPLRRVRKILIFLLQLAMIIAVAMLAARPAVVNGNSCDYIVIIDASASMQMVDESGTSRFAYALEQTEDLAKEIANGHTISIILAASDASYLVQGSTSESEVQLALNSAACTYGDCNLSEAVSLAQMMVQHSDKSEVVFFTDREYIETENVRVVNLDKDEWNVSMESLSAKSEGEATLFTGSLVSYHKNATVSVGLRVDGKVVSAQVVDCPMDTAVEVVFTAEKVSRFDTAEVFVEASDALAADNTYAVCQRNVPPYKVTLVSASPLYLRSALESLDNCRVTVANSLKNAKLSGQDLYIFDGITPDKYPTDGSVLVFGTNRLPDGLREGEDHETAAPLTMSNKVLTAIYDGLSLEGTVVGHYTALTSNALWNSVLFCEDYTVFATRKMDNNLHFSVISFDLHDSNLPMQTDFLVLMRNIVEYSVPAFLKDTDHTVGETVELTVMPTAKGVYVELPDGSVRTLSTAGDTTSLTVDEVGLYTAVMKTKDGGEYVDFFVHIPAGEVVSDVVDRLEITTSSTTDVPAEEAISEIWFWVAAAMLVILLVEWGWYYREQY